MKKYFVFSFTLVLSLAYSCSSDYDLDKVDKNVCIGGEDFVFPLGTSTKMVPDSLLNFSNIKELQTDDLGNYFFNYSGTVGQTISFLSLASKMSLPKQTGSINPAKGTLPILSDEEISHQTFPFPFTITVADELYFSYDLSSAAQEGLRRLDSVKFEASVIKVTAKVKGDGITSFPKMGLTSVVVLPQRYNISDPRVTRDTLVAYTSISSSGSVTYDPIDFNKACFTDSPTVFKYSDTLRFHTLRVEIPDAASYKALMGKEISVSYSVLMETKDGGVMIPETAWCLVEREADSVNERIDITGIPEYMRDGVLDLVSPLLGLDFTTNATVPVKVDADITSYADASIIGSASASIITDFVETPYRKVTSSYILADEDVGAPGYTFVKTDLRSVVKKIPDVIALTITPTTYVSGPSDQQVVFLTEPTDVDINYNFSLPLAFGPDMLMEYRDTLTNMPEILGDVLVKRDISLIGDATSTLPVDLTVKVNFLDQNGESLDMVSSEAVIKGTAVSGTPQESSFSMNVEQSSSAENISKLELIFSMKNGQSVTLTKEDYVQLSLQASVPGGIELEID